MIGQRFGSGQSTVLSDRVAHAFQACIKAAVFLRRL